MYYLIYGSKSKELIEDDQLEHILVHSGIFNKFYSITGMLLYSEGRFLQHIEGNKDDVYNLWNAIQNDCRHTEITKFAEGVIVERYFQDWTMGYKSKNFIQLNHIEGYRNPNDVDHLRSSSVHTLFKVLAAHNIRTVANYDTAYNLV